MMYSRFIVVDLSSDWSFEIMSVSKLIFLFNKLSSLYSLYVCL